MKRNHAARLVFEYSELEQPGDFFYQFNRHGEAFRIVYNCPCGCGDKGGLPIDKSVKRPQAWKWDGNIERPTLTPSINHINHWHGYLTNGEFVEC